MGEQQNGVLRTLTPAELEESLDLSSFAFQYELGAEQRAERLARLDPEYVWGYFVDDQMAAKLVQLPLSIHLNGVSIPMGGVAGVATWPEYRRQGAVDQLLKHTIALFRERGFSISYLHPFSFAFYRKYGWEACFDYKKYEIPMDLLKGLGSNAGMMKAVTEPMEHWHLFNEIYAKFADRYHGMLDRDEAWWKQHKLNKSGRYSVYYDDRGEPGGYIIYEVKNRQLSIHEFVHLNEQARLGLIHFITNHDSMAEKVTLSVAADDELPFLIPNPKFKQELIAYFMARIVDFKAFIEQYRFQGDGQEYQLLFEIEDEQAEWNHGSFLVRVDGEGKAQATLLDKPKEAIDSSGYVRTNIQILTVLLLGYRRPATLVELGKLDIDKQTANLLHLLIPQKTTYLPDFF